MAKLKGVAFGIRDVLAQQGTVDDAKFKKVGRLVTFLDKHGIECVAVSNTPWVSTSGGEKRPLAELLNERWGVTVQCYCYDKDGFPAKQSAAALEHIRTEKSWAPNEMLYVGNSEADMQSAVNGGVLFINALWFEDTCEYGIRLKTPREVARFIDTFCLREHWWYYAIEESGLRVYTLAPFSTYTALENKPHSVDFIKTVKDELGDEESVAFWAWYLATSIYFSGVYKDVNYIAPYPCHTKDKYPTVLREPLSVFAKCFRAKYLGDLIIRHTDAIESKRNRDAASHDRQLNTIKLNKTPWMTPKKRYKHPPLGRNKTVLVLDDILTEGYSLDSARTLIERTGASVVSVALLKTLNRPYRMVEGLDFSAMRHEYYEAYDFPSLGSSKVFGYSEHIVDRDAAADLSERLQRYKDWKWPK